MDNRLLALAFFVLLLVIPAYASALSNTIHTGLWVYGAPPGSDFIWRMAPNYTTIITPITSYSTFIPINISSSTNSTYHGRIPWQYQGAGTTIGTNGTIYTMLTGTQDTCSIQIITWNGLNNFCDFYIYLNSSLWNSNESAELKAASTFTVVRLELMPK